MPYGRAATLARAVRVLQINPSSPISPNCSKEIHMKYRRLGKTELRVPVIGVGTWQFGGEWGKTFSQGDADRILGRAADLGMNLIDTAECYGDHYSERLIGNAIRGSRDSWIIATKFGHKFNGFMDRTSLFSPEEVIKQLHDSLRALDTDYVDIYQCHSAGNDEFDQPNLWEVLNRQVEAGKIRHLGISISPNDNLFQTAKATQFGVKTIQVIYKRLDQEPEAEVLPSCQQQDLGVLSRVPLASGLLSGKYHLGDHFTQPHDHRSRINDEKIQRRLEQTQKIQRDEVPAGVEMAPWALAWCLQHPAVSCVIPGCKTVAQVESNALAADTDLVSDDHPRAWV
jgi:aryl-alcohol dehydrogenase-like predicted oxidoreductase